MKSKVVITQHRLLHYRCNFFNKLREQCLLKNIELRLVHGRATENERIRKDEGTLDWADVLDNRNFRLFGRDILWQPMPSSLKDADLLILMQENRIISNYMYLLTPKKFRSLKIGYWGHGINFQSRSSNGLRERWKKYLISKADWWFAYTQATVNILTSVGYPKSKISCLNNAIDTSRMQFFKDNVKKSDLAGFRESLKIPSNVKLGVFCGSLYPDKKLDLLIAASDLIKDKQARYHLVIIGDGPSLNYLKKEAESRDWIHLMGVRKGFEKAVIFSQASVILNPGALGLHILDAFIFGKPIVSTSNAYHGPEIAYLKKGENGILTKDSTEDYANTVLELFTNRPLYSKICFNAKLSSEQYTLDNMVSSFMEGIEKALSLPV